MTSHARDHIAELARRRRALLEELRTRPDGLDWCYRHTEIIDEVIRTLYESIVAKSATAPPLAIIATGGYGRRELSPYSDIDLTVVPAEEASSELDDTIRTLFQELHEAIVTTCGLDIGYAYRLISDAPGLDTKTRTGLIDMRLVAGSSELMRGLELALVETLSIGEFVLAKTRERERMFAKYHDTPYVVEPNLKEGAGGLRCFHCGNWIRESIGERALRPTPDCDLIIRFRNLLHLISGKSQDSLTRQRQAEIADILGVDLYAMMADVVAAGEKLHTYYRRSADKLYEGRFRLSKSVLAAQGEARIEGDADGGDAAVGIAMATALGIAVSDIATAAPRHVDGPAAAYALATGEQTLRNLDRCGLLQNLIPELTACRTLIPADNVHRFTVYEHTLRAVRLIDDAPHHPFLAEVRAQITDLETLYLATLLHDVGKVDPNRDHSEYGAEIAGEVCRRWGLAASVREDVQWLVREHLTMARFVRVRDTQNPHTITEFAKVVEKPDRLHMLTLLTWVDIGSVAEDALTPTLETFLKDLYHRTLSALEQESEVGLDPGLYRQRLLRALRHQVDDPEAVQRFVNNLPAYYLTSTPSRVIRLHMQFVQKAIAGTPSIEVFPRAELDATEITVCCLDQPSLLSRLLGVLYAFDLSISAIRASTTTTDPPVALDVFIVSFGGRTVPAATMQHVNAAIADIIEGRQSVEELLIRKGKDPARQQQVFAYTYVPGSPGILEVRSPRGRGMPFRFSRLLANQGWNVVAARVGQWAGNGAAAFYIVDAQGGEVSRDQVDRALTDIVPPLSAED